MSRNDAKAIEWHMDKGTDGAVIYHLDVGTIANVPDILMGWEYNVDLIFAAPKMRDALEYAVSKLSAFKMDALKKLGLDVAFEGIRNALAAAGPDASEHSVTPSLDLIEQLLSEPNHSPGPWAYEYSPYTVQEHGGDGGVPAERELPAFEIFDAEGTKIFDTNEHLPAEIQEPNARLAVASPALVAALEQCATVLAVHENHAGQAGEAYRNAIAALTEAFPAAPAAERLAAAEAQPLPSPAEILADPKAYLPESGGNRSGLGRDSDDGNGR